MIQEPYVVVPCQYGVSRHLHSEGDHLGTSERNTYTTVSPSLKVANAMQSASLSASFAGFCGDVRMPSSDWLDSRSTNYPIEG